MLTGIANLELQATNMIDLFFLTQKGFDIWS